MSKKIYGIPVSTPINPAKVNPEVPQAKIAASVAAYMEENPITPSGIGARPDTWTPTAEEVGARPDTWMPSASDVGARPNTWMPSASDVGATPASHAENKNNPHGVTAAQVGARPNTWMPTAADVGARPNTWMPTAAQVGARANTWLPTIAEIGAAPAGYGLGSTSSQQIGNRDFNDIVENGWYLWNSTTGTTLNVPFEAGQMLVVARDDGRCCTQIAFDANKTTSIKVRSQGYDKTWSAWADWSPSAFAPAGNYAPGDFGLGRSAKSITDLNACLTNGWYWTGGSTANMPKGMEYSSVFVRTRLDGQIAQFICCLLGSSAGLQVVRYTVDGGVTWYEEWVNPRMLFGVEYRTTERWYGEVVYTKLIDFGALPDNTYSSVSTGVTGVTYIGHTMRVIDSEGDESSGTSIYMGGLLSAYSWIDPTDNKFSIRTTKDCSDWHAYCIIKYYKN